MTILFSLLIHEWRVMKKTGNLEQKKELGWKSILLRCFSTRVSLQEFHENLIRRGLFRKRSVSLEDGVQGLASDDFMLPRSLPTSPTSPTAVSGTRYHPHFYYVCNREKHRRNSTPWETSARIKMLRVVGYFWSSVNIEVKFVRGKDE